MSLYKKTYTVEKALYACFTKEIMTSRNYSAVAPMKIAAEESSANKVAIAPVLP